MKTATKILIIVGIVLGFPLIIPAIVGIISIKKLDKATCKKDILWVSILTLFLCNIFAGILMLCLRDKDFTQTIAETEKHNKSKKSLRDKWDYFRLRRIKKWMFCPSCKNGKMSFNKKKSHWICEDCGYSFSEEYFLDDCIFWFCDECGAYLNNQDDFNRNEPKHICNKCGFENDITENNIKGVCADCGKLLADSDATICVACRQVRKEKAQKRILVAGVVAAGAVAVVGAAAVATQSVIDSALDGIDTDNLPLLDDDSDDIIEDRLIYSTNEWKGYTKNSYYSNEYWLEDGKVVKYKCSREKHFDGDENEWISDKRMEASWETDDPTMPEWLNNYI